MINVKWQQKPPDNKHTDFNPESNGVTKPATQLATPREFIRKLLNGNGLAKISMLRQRRRSSVTCPVVNYRRSWFLIALHWINRWKPIANTYINLLLEFFHRWRRSRILCHRDAHSLFTWERTKRERDRYQSRGTNVVEIIVLRTFAYKLPFFSRLCDVGLSTRLIYGWRISSRIPSSRVITGSILHNPSLLTNLYSVSIATRYEDPMSLFPRTQVYSLPNITCNVYRLPLRKSNVTSCLSLFTTVFVNIM